jgi:tight adherence protein C
MLLLAAAGIFAALGLIVFTLLDQADERATVRASLRTLDGYEVDNLRDKELLAPVKERAIAPVASTLTSLGRRFTPAGYVETSRKKHVALGEIGPEALDKFLAIRVITVALVPVAFIGVFAVLHIHGGKGLMMFAFLTLALMLGPDAVLNRKVEERRHRIRVSLPDILDLLTISVEAGLGFEQALDRTVHAVPGPLSEEFARMLGETRAGATRADAMRALDERVEVPEVRSFVLAILQADTFGVSIGRILRGQADEMRIKRRQLAQEQAQKAPVKMLIPMVFCVFPALFVVVLGPAAINISRAF